MIQELLETPATSSPLLGHVSGGDRNSISHMITSDQAGFLQASLSSFSSSPSLFLPNSSSSSSPTTTAYTPPPSAPNNQTTTNGVNQEPQNLRCPRCDSTNTKFCYYNNYNLTQPRHFCKTCRRYWTKGGALRNVPIGGGCRKNKLATSGSCGGGSGSSNGKYSGSSKAPKSCLSISDQITGRPHGDGYGFGFGFDQPDLLVPSNPLHVFWPPPPAPSQGSHILALLRSAQSPNPSSNTGYNHPHTTQFLKNEGPITINGRPNNESNNFEIGGGAKIFGGESYKSELPASMAPPAGSWWRSNQYIQGLYNQKENESFAQNEAQTGSATDGLQELLQRLRSTSKGGHFGDHQTVVLSNDNIPSSSPNLTTSAATSVTGSATNAMDEDTGNLGSYNNLPLSWSNLHNRKPSGGSAAYP